MKDILNRLNTDIIKASQEQQERKQECQSESISCNTLIDGLDNVTSEEAVVRARIECYVQKPVDIHAIKKDWYAIYKVFGTSRTLEEAEKALPLPWSMVLNRILSQYVIQKDERRK